MGSRFGGFSEGMRTFVFGMNRRAERFFNERAPYFFQLRGLGQASRRRHNKFAYDINLTSDRQVLGFW